MKKSTFTIIFTLLFVGLAVISCGKYEEGPGVSLLPKNTRLQQQWKPVESINATTGLSSTIADDGSYLEFVKGGSLKYYDHATFSPFGFDALTGTWEFSDDKTQLITSYTIIGQTVTDTFTIIKLKINDLGLMDSDGDKTYFEYK